MFVLTVFITALLWVTFGSQTTHAAGPVATWKGDTLLYDGHQFYANAEAKKDNKLGLKEGTKFYTYAPEASSGSATVKAFIIYFSPGTDPPNEKNATFVKYDYSAQKGYSNQSDKKTIEVTPSGDENSTNSCSVDGIGWVICPVTTWLANGMDALFQFISDNFLKVQPVTVTNTNTNLYVSWNIMRTIANIAFIIVFLMIIYAQLTSTAVSNYGIKKLLPRLIIASILVNVSYFIASLAVDISNILGFSLQEVFVNIRQNTFNITNDTWSAETQGWTALTTAVLAGVGVGAIAFNPAILFMIVPLLIGAALSALFALLILSVRQAIIIILIIIGPLAFVAYLLPNTEQWFKKWRELFTNMLIFFPAFSLVFGGSQLASSIIMQNATSMFMIALALAVQVAPLAITPLILRFSGGVLGRIAGLVNNPRKGMLDRSKNWANSRVEMGRQKALRNGATKNPFRRVGQAMNNSNRRTKDLTDLYSQQSDNRYRNTDKYASLQEQSHETETDKKLIDARLDRNLHENMLQNPHHFEKQVKLSNMTQDAANRKAALETALDNTKVGIAPVEGPQTVSMTNMLDASQRLAIESAAINAGKHAAESSLQSKVANAFNVELKEDKSNQAEYIASQALLRVAGGVEGEKGITRARSGATAVLTKQNKEALENNVTLLQYEALQRGMTVKQYTNDFIVQRALRGDTNVKADQLEAALEVQATDGQVNIIEAARSSMDIDQSLVDRVIARNAGTMKEKGGFHLQATPELSLQRYLAAFKNGGLSGRKLKEGDAFIDVSTEAQAESLFRQDLLRSQLDSLSNTTADHLGAVKYGAYVNLANNFEQMINTMNEDDPKDQATLRKVHNAVQIALTDEGIYGSITDRLEETRKMDEILSNKFGTEQAKRKTMERVQPGNRPDRPETGDYHIPDVDPTAEHPADSND
jgi:hypothetical protein